MQNQSLNIVVVDGHTTSADERDWAPLAALGRLVVHERSGDEIVNRCREADVILTNKEPLPDHVLAQLPRLRLISVLATGTNVVDVAAATRRGIVVSNVPRYSTASVAQHVFALLLELNNRVTAHARAASTGEWSRSGHFSYRLGPIHELADKTLGIVGLGAIGQRVAHVGSVLGMHVAAARRPGKPDAPFDDFDVHWLDLDALFETADVVTLHCPLSPETFQLVNRERLNRMPQGALLINTGRGDLIDEAALCDALHQGRLRGAGLDVLSQEPPPPDHPLLSAPNCLITPHLAWASVEARRRLIDVSVENVRAFLAGSPQNVVG